MTQASEETKPKSGAERTREYHRRMREMGYVRLSVWIHENCRDDFEREFARLQERWARGNMLP